MKKKLEAELMSIAHSILKLKGKDDINKMHAEVAKLYEKLTVLKFARENFDEDIPTIGNDSSFFDMLDVAFNNKVSDTIEFENKTYINVDDSDQEEIMEPAIEKIKDMVAQMPQETQAMDTLIETVVSSKTKVHKTHLDDITAGFDAEPIFEPVKKTDATEKKTLNDKLNKGLVIGLNDKIAFIKHLFNGAADDYNRVISQVNTLDSLEEAEHLILNIVKPDYNNWDGKTDFEARFMELIARKFN
ncbi:hypothetical protein ACFSQP_06450 [Bizionia sediminis]|uniref:DUF3387 domain-containing protein n=1 Tax=Bizionia sediminis TaxID=1737064 RepID=A0ABW5KRI4_9FLAO